MYEITCDRAAGILHVTLSGMLTVDEVSEYIASLKQTYITNGLRTYSMMIDVSRCPIQHQDVIRAIGLEMATMPKAKALAFVTGSSLAKMQIRRLFTQPYVRIVDTIAAGQLWILAGVEPPAC